MPSVQAAETALCASPQHSLERFVRPEIRPAAGAGDNWIGGGVALELDQRLTRRSIARLSASERTQPAAFIAPQAFAYP